MRLFSGRRLPAGIGAVVALALILTFGQAIPAHADPVAPPISASISDVTVTVGGQAFPYVTLDAGPGVDPVLQNSTLTVDATDLAGVVAWTSVGGFGGISCTYTQGPVTTCSISAGAYARFGGLHLGIYASQAATLGRSGTLKLTLADGAAAPVTTTSTVTVGETVDLTNTYSSTASYIKTEPGGAFTEKLGVRNSGSTVVNGVTMLLRAPYAFSPTKQYSNCRYSGASNMFCMFDAALQPGVEYELAEPLSFRVPLDAARSSGDPTVNARLSWHTPADAVWADHADLSGFSPGQGGQLGLVVKQSTVPAPAAQATVPQAEVNLGDNTSIVSVDVYGEKEWDFEGVGAAVNGAVGETVTASVGFTNVGPGAPEGSTETLVVIPPGTTVVAAPLPCYAIIAGTNWRTNQAKPGAQRYWCFTHDTFIAVGSRQRWDFGLRIDRHIDNATGRVEINGYGGPDTSSGYAYLEDRNATDDPAAIVVNPTSADVWTGGAGLSGSPALIHDPNNGQVGYYGTTRVFADSAGTLVTKGCYLGGYWAYWSKLWGDITGTPAVVTNPVNQHVEIYANSGGHLAVFDGSQQSNWMDLGGDITGDPVALYNPNNGNIEVYANSHGHLVETYRNATSMAFWSGWGDFGGNIAGKPAAFYDPNNHNIEIYANSGGNMVELYWQASNGHWNGWNSFGGSLSGGPTAFYNPNNHNVELYANSKGNLVEKYWQAGNGAWSGWNSFGGNLTGNPAALYNPNNHNVELYANSGGNMVELYWQAANGHWNGWNSFGGNLTGDVTVYYDPDDHNVEIYGVSNRQLTEKYWNASNGAWTGWNSL